MSLVSDAGAQTIWPEIVCSEAVLDTGKRDQVYVVISVTKLGILWRTVRETETGARG